MFVNEKKRSQKGDSQWQHPFSQSDSTVVATVARDSDHWWHLTPAPDWWSAGFQLIRESHTAHSDGINFARPSVCQLVLCFDIAKQVRDGPLSLSKF